MAIQKRLGNYPKATGFAYQSGGIIEPGVPIARVESNRVSCTLWLYRKLASTINCLAKVSITSIISLKTNCSRLWDFRSPLPQYLQYSLTVNLPRDNLINRLRQQPSRD